MDSDFSGYATKAGLKCSDGRTIMPDAFKQQDTMKVPLVWQHGHSDPENVLGHAILENREDGVYAYGFFNSSAKAVHTHGLLEHGDINMMSIWANDLIERSGRVLHGAIREVSLVLSGANPGALIENVTLRHADGEELTLDDEVIIYTGLELEHENIAHADGDAEPSADSADEDGELTVEDILKTYTKEQTDVLNYLLGEALETAAKEEPATAEHSNLNQEGTPDMTTRNVFEKKEDAASIGGAVVQHSLSHSQIKGIVADADKIGSLKDAVENYALAHGISDIDVLFPEAQTIGTTPEFLARRSEWVASVLSGTRKSPFSRVKTFHADITMEEARAKGYIKGNMKKEEFFGVSKRVTTPTTVYKKQKLDRDDMIDITDFDVVTWLKGEMRLMLDEELARAVLIGDGRDVAHDDKINMGNIRPIATDHELYTTVVNVNIDDANSSFQEVVDAIVTNRAMYKGTGLPTMYTTETYISKALLLKDTVGRRIYKTLDELASELRVSSIVPVEVMEEEEDIIAILVNLNDYVMGADKGGNIAMFDDFDIDYNQYKYLIETRCSGALTKLKSAMVIRKVSAASTLVSPNKPLFSDGDITIVATTGVKYFNAATEAEMTVASSPYAVAPGTSIMVNAVAQSGKHFATSEGDSWTFKTPAA